MFFYRLTDKNITAFPKYFHFITFKSIFCKSVFSTWFTLYLLHDWKYILGKCCHPLQQYRHTVDVKSGDVLSSYFFPLIITYRQ